ncbi:HEPN domain-containing protein [Xenorhabdus sp. SF857]|uniref:HEPN domain-containing protein n=1 Tax=Xenorhabdus bakwenae TaxID=3026967 RepID=UPI002557E13E|nr:HEPN domain-containing protein [Xenorhabdus sp. SF857]WFQ78653.1 HEPN domain-containing protein [Xenorhabdus sp. SF857]
MRPFTVNYISKLNDQWREIDCIIDLADEHIHNNIDTYNSLCRSAMVLCVSHMENFYKELVKNFISDIDKMDFKLLPDAMKRQFCKQFVGYEDNKENNKKITSLINELENHGNFKISYDAFMPSKNKNPKPSIIESICDNLGTKKIFEKLSGTIFDNVFSMTDKEIERFEKIIDTSVRKRLSKQKILDNFVLIQKINSIQSKDRSLWESFFDNINTKRHDIAHGNVFENSTSTSELKVIKNKCKIFQKICISIIFSNIN